MTTEQPSFTCPDCNMTSYNPNDILHRYCGNCHEFKGETDWPQIARAMLDNDKSFFEGMLSRIFGERKGT